MSQGTLNGEGFVTRDEFLTVTEGLGDDIRAANGLFVNYVDSSKRFLADQSQREREFFARIEARLEKLERRLGHVKQSATDSYNDLKNEALKAELVRLAAEKKEAEARRDSFMRRNRSWTTWAVRLVVGAIATGLIAIVLKHTLFQ